MSVDAGLSLQLSCKNGLRSIVQALLSSEWGPHAEGWHCVPLDQDTSEWTLLGNNSREIEMLFSAKMAAKQVFGIRLWWKGGETGGEFLVFESGEIVFSPTTNRVTLDGRVTDVSWYLERLLPVFQRSPGVVVDNWAWRETS